MNTCEDCGKPIPDRLTKKGGFRMRNQDRQRCGPCNYQHRLRRQMLRYEAKKAEKKKGAA